MINCFSMQLSVPSWLWIAFGCLAVIIVAVLFFSLKKRERPSDLVQDDILVIKKNTAKIRTLISINTDENIKPKLKELLDTVEYLSPIGNRSAIDIDIKITSRLEEIKELIVKNSDNRNSAVINKEIKNIIDISVSRNENI